MSAISLRHSSAVNLKMRQCHLVLLRTQPVPCTASRVTSSVQYNKLHK